MSDSSKWLIYRGDGKEAPERLAALPDPPPWRDLSRQYQHRGETYQATPHDIQMVNAALYLRRPLLVTGPPGSGKSSLAYAVARELGLGAVLKWPINSRSTLAQGLYEYDAIARLRDLQEQSQHANGWQASPVSPTQQADVPSEYSKSIGDYVRLGPLGTALYSADPDSSSQLAPKTRPRALLIDEIDKSDIDFPNDLLNVLEEGQFEIPELARIAAKAPVVEVLAWKGDTGTAEQADQSTGAAKRTVREGKVRCTVFPFIVVTNNGERELPPAFLRRCLRLDIKAPAEPELRQIIDAHFGPEGAPSREAHVSELLQRFTEVQDRSRLIAVDQLLNAIFLVSREHAPSEQERGEVLDVIMRALDEA